MFLLFFSRAEKQLNVFVRFSARARKVKLFFLDGKNGRDRMKGQEVNNDWRKWKGKIERKKDIWKEKSGGKGKSEEVRRKRKKEIEEKIVYEFSIGKGTTGRYDEKKI